MIETMAAAAEASEAAEAAADVSAESDYDPDKAIDIDDIGDDESISAGDIGYYDPDKPIDIDDIEYDKPLSVGDIGGYDPDKPIDIDDIKLSAEGWEGEGVSYDPENPPKHRGELNAVADGKSVNDADNQKKDHFDEEGNLKPNAEYTTGEHDYHYKTDDQGRIIHAETDDLKLTDRDERLPHDSDTPGKQEGDDAGHLIGDRFGGSPEIDNLISQSSDVNRGEYKKMENEWADAIKNGEKVEVKIDVKYEGDDKRPSEIIVQYKIGDGDWEERSFDNRKQNEGE